MLTCKAKKIVSCLGWVLIVVMACSLLSMILSEKITGKKTIFGYMPMFVASESMLPKYKVGDLIVGKPVSAEELQVGDVVAYKLVSPMADRISVTVVHRVVDITDGGFVFKGDNNEECDALVTSEQILYKVIYPTGD